MVNEEKIRIMTQIALDETKRYKSAIEESGYYKSDYIRAHVISVVWNLTVSYVLVLFLVALYHADYIFVNVARLEYDKLGFAVLGIYAGIVILSLFFSYFHFKRKYIKSLSALKEYYTKLKKLEDFYMQHQNKEEAGDGTITGV